MLNMFNFVFKKISQLHGWYVSMKFLTKHERNLIVHGFYTFVRGQISRGSYTYFLLFHFFSLETVQKILFLRMYLGNVNVSVVTCQYRQIY